MSRTDTIILTVLLTLGMVGVIGGAFLLGGMTCEQIVPPIQEVKSWAMSFFEP